MARKRDPERYAEKRRQILEGAVACFARQGFHGTSTAQICAAAGISSGHLFHYFDSKEAIVEAIVEADRQEMARLFARAQTTDSPVHGLLDLLDECLVLAADRDYVRIGIEVTAEALRNPRIAAVFARCEAELKAGLVGLLRRASEQGEIDPKLDLDKTATWITAVADGAIGRAALDPTFRPSEHRDVMRTLVARFLCARHER